VNPVFCPNFHSLDIHDIFSKTLLTSAANSSTTQQARK